MLNPLRHLQPHVATATLTIVVAFVAYTLWDPATAGRQYTWLKDQVTTGFGWFYLVSVTFFLVFVLYMAIGRYARIKLGKDDSVPEFSRLAWFTMLFSAGMGIGLVFWGVAEPISHYAQPPLAEPGTTEAMQDALRYSFFHWGLHTWAIYIIVALSLALFHFRYELPFAPRTLFYPIFKDKVHGPIGHAIDTIVIVATLFGLATSLGLGALQITTGLNISTGIPDTLTTAILVIAIITTIATISVVHGIDRGIRRVSNFNMVLASALLVFILLVGPTLFIMESLVTGIGRYLWTLPQTSLLTGDIAPVSAQWQADWTLFYWGWWMSWAPFVGLFIARVSKGRTIREFITGVLLVPVGFGFLWFAVFGGTAMFIEHELGGRIWQATEQDESLALYAMLEHVPLSTLISIAATLLVVTFFVTSIDSGALITGMIATGGHDPPPFAQRVLWATIKGLLAAMLLLAGGLEALQTAATTMGLPMAILMILMCIAIVRVLHEEHTAGKKAAKDKAG